MSVGIIYARLPRLPHAIRYVVHLGVLYLLYLDVAKFDSITLWILSVFFTMLIIALNTRLLQDVVRVYRLDYSRLDDN